MSLKIKEADWKLFSQFHRIAVERFCQRILWEIGQINSDGAKSPHQRYLEIYDVVKRRDKEIAQTFDDFRRSTAMEKLAVIQSKGLLTDEEFSRFSPETRDFVDRLLGD